MLKKDLAASHAALLRQFTPELHYMLAGSAGVLHSGGLGAGLTEYRKPHEPNRPVAVTLEPTPSGLLMLGLVVSRPERGKLVYSKTLNRWDFSRPVGIQHGLSMRVPEHRLLVDWGMQLLSGMITTGKKLYAGGDLVPMVCPTMLVPFTGEYRVDPVKLAAKPDAVISQAMVPGQTVVDAAVATDADIAAALRDNTALEDFSPVLGRMIPNPFAGAEAAIVDIVATRRKLPMSIARGATNADILSAAANPGEDMRLSRHSRVQVVAIEELYELPAPYAGSMLPPASWLAQSQSKPQYATL